MNRKIIILTREKKHQTKTGGNKFNFSLPRAYLLKYVMYAHMISYTFLLYILYFFKEKKIRFQVVVKYVSVQNKKNKILENLKFFGKSLWGIEQTFNVLKNIY